MTRRLSATETPAYRAMCNAIHLDDEATIALGTDVLIANGMGRKDAEKVARSLFNEMLKYYGPT